MSLYLSFHHRYDPRQLKTSLKHDLVVWLTVSISKIMYLNIQMTTYFPFTSIKIIT